MSTPRTVFPRRQTTSISRRLAQYSLGAVAATGSAGMAYADFGGDYTLVPPDPAITALSGTQTFGTWTSDFADYENSVGDLNDLAAPASLTLDETAPGNSVFFTEYFSNTVSTTGTLSFSYSLTGTEDDAAVILGGTYNNLSGTGSMSDIAITSGESLEFLFEGYSAGSLTISDFSAPGDVPEASTAGWLAAGAVGLLAMRSARRRATAL